MRRIIASLFVVVAITGAGVLATGAYFQVKTEVDGVTFSAGTANIALAVCEGVDCSLPGVDPDAGDLTVGFGDLPGHPTIGPVGPGYSQTFCLAIQAIDYDLNITQTETLTSDPALLRDAVDLKIAASNSVCQAGGAVLAFDTLRGLHNVTVNLKTPLAKGATAYFLETLSWDPTADDSLQNGLQNQTLALNAVIAGTTPH